MLLTSFFVAVFFAAGAFLGAAAFFVAGFFSVPSFFGAAAFLGAAVFLVASFLGAAFLGASLSPSFFAAGLAAAGLDFLDSLVPPEGPNKCQKSGS